MYSFRRLIVLLVLLLGGGLGAEVPLDRVRLQLKWTHQFQFAGYYAAIAQGYYREAGLDVQLLEAVPGRDPVDAVLAGGAEFGVGTSELLVRRGRGEPVVVLAAIYQHSPLALLAPKTARTRDLHSLHDQPLMIEPQAAELFAYFKHEGVDTTQLKIVPHSFGVRDLIEGRVAAMSVYESDEPYQLRQAGVDYLLFTPRAGGIDFYGDNLFATEAQIRDHPERVRAFRAASLRGWNYALAHPDEIIGLIQRQYGSTRERAHLQFEAAETVQLMHPGLIEVGHMNAGRWRHIADTYAEFGMLPRAFDLAGFLYDPNPRPDYTRFYWVLGALSVVAVAALGWVLPLVRLNRQLQRAKETAEAARAAAEAADAAKSHYLAFLAHEIRTPLNGLVGVVDVLQHDPTDKELRAGMGLVAHSTQHLLQLVDNVLDHSRIESGQMEIEQVPVVLGDFLADITGLFTPAAQAKGVALRLDLAPGLPAAIRTDPIRLRQILSNLVSNAVKFTKQGEIVLGAEALGPTRLAFSVRDTGVGIPAEVRERIFEPYRQADASVARRYGGTGLGLSISQRLARLLGGGITVRSGPLRGSTFTVEIVAAKAE